MPTLHWSWDSALHGMGSTLARQRCCPSAVPCGAASAAWVLQHECNSAMVAVQQAGRTRGGLRGGCNSALPAWMPPCMQHSAMPGCLHPQPLIALIPSRTAPSEQVAAELLA